jgi:hypothetical protein
MQDRVNCHSELRQAHPPGRSRRTGRRVEDVTPRSQSDPLNKSLNPAYPEMSQGGRRIDLFHPVGYISGTLITKLQEADR